MTEDWELTLGTDLVALEVESGVVKPGRSLYHHVDIDRQLEAHVSRAREVHQERLDLLRHYALVGNAQRGCAQCVLVGGVLDADCIAQLSVSWPVNGVQIKFSSRVEEVGSGLPGS